MGGREAPAARLRLFSPALRVRTLKLNLEGVSCSVLTSDCGCRGASKPEKLLDEDDFSFLKNDCAAEKWVAVELSLRVRVSSLQLVMLELYSSRIKDFEVYGAPTKPVMMQAVVPWEQPPWEFLGSFRAQNKKGQQVWRSKRC
jgi:hypothetical protein